MSPLHAISQLVKQSTAIDQRFSAFSKELDSLRIVHHIPGLAAAIVKDQKLSWSKGYGNSHFDVSPNLKGMK